jgi:hypothetical protein
MKKLVLIFILTFSFQTLAKADDIRDFQIEGMSIGDSLLDFFSEEEIKKSLIASYPNSDKYKRIQIIKHKQFKTYKAMHLLYLKNDKKKIIHSLDAMIEYENKIKACLNQRDIILDSIVGMFKDVNIDDQGKRIHNLDKSKKSFVHDVQIKFINNDRVTIACFDWSKKMKFKDHLRVSIANKDFIKWLNNEAYK